MMRDRSSSSKGSIDPLTTKDDDNGKGKSTSPTRGPGGKKTTLWEHFENGMSTLCVFLLVTGFFMFYHRRQERVGKVEQSETMKDRTMQQIAADIAGDAFNGLKSSTLDDIVNTYTGEVNEHGNKIFKDIALAAADRLDLASTNLKTSLGGNEQAVTDVVPSSAEVVAATSPPVAVETAAPVAVTAAPIAVSPAPKPQENLRGMMQIVKSTAQPSAAPIKTPQQMNARGQQKNAQTPAPTAAPQCMGRMCPKAMQATCQGRMCPRAEKGKNGFSIFHLRNAWKEEDKQLKNKHQYQLGELEKAHAKEADKHREEIEKLKKSHALVWDKTKTIRQQALDAQKANAGQMMM